MKTIKFQLPDTVDIEEREVLILLAAKLYEEGKLSLGQAAELAKLSKRTFAELLGKYGVSIFNYPPSDIKGDIKNA